MTERPEPEIHVVGPGEPVAAVVGGVHGDEPCGVWAVRRLRGRIEAGELELNHAVKLIVANPPAVAANERFLAVDMNRSFPGDVDGLDEEHLASVLCGAIADIPTLTLHSTHSRLTPFA
ncbi:MAG: succinylglutamate desuccinylase, partial [Halobacteriota archaeon]